MGAKLYFQKAKPVFRGIFDRTVILKLSLEEDSSRNLLLEGLTQARRPELLSFKTLADTTPALMS